MANLNLLFIHLFENFISIFDIIIISSLFLLISYLKYLEKPKEEMKSSLLLKLDSSIYQSKDILLQDIGLKKEDFPIRKTSSIYTKIIIFSLIVIVIITPLYQLFGIKYFL